MIDYNTLQDAVDIILDRILTPVLYMYDEEVLEFICFTDSNISEDEIRSTEETLLTTLGVSAEIIDIRNFDESDRVDITTGAVLVYAEDDMIKTLFEAAMSADRERMLGLKRETLKRKTETGTYYIS